MKTPTKLVLGTAQFGLSYGINNSIGQPTESEVFNIFNYWIKSNLSSTLDTAAVYGNSEERIGNYFESVKVEKEFRIITKFNLKNGLSLLDSLNISLERLKVSCLDTIMFHSFEDFNNASSSEVNNLLEFKGKKFLNLGISLYTNEQVYKVYDSGLFNVIQLPFNALDNHNLRGNVIAELRNKGIETHTRSVFLQGLFFTRFNNLPKKLKPLGKYLKKLDELAKEYSITKESLALQYALSKDYIDGVLVGVDSLDQLRSNVLSINREIPREVFREVDNIKVDEFELLNPVTWHQ
jgi:aryl-alcohol dehydrogenase-like predicted oxidoreductase